jgi:hypothetical protein
MAATQNQPADLQNLALPEGQRAYSVELKTPGNAARRRRTGFVQRNLILGQDIGYPVRVSFVPFHVVFLRFQQTKTNNLFSV